MEKLMTVDDVAKYLSLNREVVLRKARKGEIPAVKAGPKTYRFYREQVDEWLRSKTTIRPEPLAYPLRDKERMSKKQLPSIIKETTTRERIVKKTAIAGKARQLLVLEQAARLRAKIAKRVGKPLPDSAQEIRALREERAHCGS